MAMRPLEKLPTIRAKLGSVIVLAVAVTLLVSYVLIAFYLRNSPRDTEEIAARLLRVVNRAEDRRVGGRPVGDLVIPGDDGHGGRRGNPGPGGAQGRQQGLSPLRAARPVQCRVMRRRRRRRRRSRWLLRW